MTITNKSTKAEILAAYEAVSTAYAADRAQAVAPTITAQAVSNTAQVFAAELVALVKDVYRLGLFCRKGFETLVDTYSKPVLKASMSVNN